jgi:hypothetical protein
LVDGEEQADFGLIGSTRSSGEDEHDGDEK